MGLLQRLRTLGWAVIEAAFLLIVLCVLLNVILGAAAGPFVSGVASNATDLLQRLPPGVSLGVALIAIVYGLVKSRLQR